MTHAFLTQMYAASAVLGILFIIYMIRSLWAMNRIGHNPRIWVVFAVGFTLIGSSPILEYLFVRQFTWFIFYTYGIYFAFGNLLILLVLYQYWRGLEV